MNNWSLEKLLTNWLNAFSKFKNEKAWAGAGSVNEPMLVEVSNILHTMYYFQDGSAAGESEEVGGHLAIQDFNPNDCALLVSQ